MQQFQTDHFQFSYPDRSNDESAFVIVQESLEENDKFISNFPNSVPLSMYSSVEAFYQFRQNCIRMNIEVTFIYKEYYNSFIDEYNCNHVGSTMFNGHRQRNRRTHWDGR